MAQSEDRTIPTGRTEPEPSTAFTVNLQAEIEALHRTDSWARGKAAKRLNGFPNFRVSIMALQAGSSLGEHHNPGRVSIQTVAGHVHVRAGGRTFDLPVGAIAFLDRDVRHDVEALEESAFLVSVALEDRAVQ